MEMDTPFSWTGVRNLRHGRLMHYFSYGSNMASARMLRRVPSAKFVTTATLAKHDLRFHKKGKDGSGKCDAFETGNLSDRVIGVIYRIDPAEKEVLDKFEGLGYGYEEKTVSLLTDDGERREAYTYYATHIEAHLTPFQWYKHHVLTGALEHGLPKSYVDTIRYVHGMMDPDPERHDREMAIYA